MNEGTNRELTKELTEDEVKRSVFQLGGSEAPRLDGFPGLFYQRYWNVIGPNILIMVKFFLESGTLPHNINHTDIV